jgi:hypothetical protein
MATRGWEVMMVGGSVRSLSRARTHFRTSGLSWPQCAVALASGSGQCPGYIGHPLLGRLRMINMYAVNSGSTHFSLNRFYKWKLRRHFLLSEKR